MSFVMDKLKSRKGAGLQYQRNLPYLTEVQLDISDLPFVRNQDYQYYARYLDILRISHLSLNTNQLILKSFNTDLLHCVKY